MKKLKSIALLTLLLLFAGRVCAESQKSPQTCDSWLGMYVGESKIGYRHVTVRKDGIRRQGSLRVDGHGFYRAC